MQRNTSWVGLYRAILLIIAPAVAVAAPAKQDQNPSHAGQSSIYFYDVAATDMHGKGKLMIDVDKHTFEFNGQDFQPSAQIALRAKAADSPDFVIFATGKATPSGNLHIAGTWEEGATPAEVVAGTYYQPLCGLKLWNEGWFVAHLACYYSMDGGASWCESAHSDGITRYGCAVASLADLGVPEFALVKIHAVVVGGKDRTGSEVFQYWPYYHNWGLYTISGVTWKPSLEYAGIQYVP